MRCLYCQNKDTKVTDSRISESYVRRRRECLECQKRFTTYEKAQNELTVIKKDGSKQVFDRNKIQNGLQKAFEKRLLNQEQINQLTNKIENRILNLNTRKNQKFFVSPKSSISGKIEIKSQQIGSIVMKELKKIDPVAYMRFASVCKSFDDITHFEKEIKSLGGKKNP